MPPPRTTGQLAVAADTSSRAALLRHKARMKSAGFKRLQIWVHPDLLAELKRCRLPSECGGRCLERLLLGKAAQRPRYLRKSGD